MIRGSAPQTPFTLALAPAPVGRASVFHTVAKMRQLVRESMTDASIHQKAVSLIFGVPQHDQLAEVNAIHDFVTRQIRYVRDAAELESLSTPAVVLRRRVGDCDDQSMLFAALVQAVGYPTRFVLSDFGAGFEHVHTQVFACDQWINAETTEDYALGEIPGLPIRHWFEGVSP